MKVFASSPRPQSPPRRRSPSLRLPSSGLTTSTARLGAYMPQDEDLDDAGFGAGLAGEVAIGRRFTPMLTGGSSASADFRSSSDAVTFFDPDVGGDVASTSISR